MSSTIQQPFEGTKAPPLANPSGTSGYRFIEFIDTYTLKDINVIENAAKENEIAHPAGHPSSGVGRCATALASLCFSTLEQVGILLRNDLNINNIESATKSQNFDNAYNFFYFFSQRGMATVAVAELESVYYLFRNKIIHNLFPRFDLEVSLSASNNITDMVLPGNTNYKLNVNFLSNYIKLAIPLLKTFLNDAVNETQLIMLVDQNCKLIETEEHRQLLGRYNSNVHMKPYFKQWIKQISFP